MFKPGVTEPLISPEDESNSTFGISSADTGSSAKEFSLSQKASNQQVEFGCMIINEIRLFQLEITYYYFYYCNVILWITASLICIMLFIISFNKFLYNWIQFYYVTLDAIKDSIPQNLHRFLDRRCHIDPYLFKLIILLLNMSYTDLWI